MKKLRDPLELIVVGMVALVALNLAMRLAIRFLVVPPVSVVFTCPPGYQPVVMRSWIHQLTECGCMRDDYRRRNADTLTDRPAAPDVSVVGTAASANPTWYSTTGTAAAMSASSSGVGRRSGSRGHQRPVSRSNSTVPLPRAADRGRISHRSASEAGRYERSRRTKSIASRNDQTDVSAPLGWCSTVQESAAVCPDFDRRLMTKAPSVVATERIAPASGFRSRRVGTSAVSGRGIVTGSLRDPVNVLALPPHADEPFRKRIDPARHDHVGRQRLPSALERVEVRWADPVDAPAAFAGPALDEERLRPELVTLKVAALRAVPVHGAEEACPKQEREHFLRRDEGQRQKRLRVVGDDVRHTRYGIKGLDYSPVHAVPYAAMEAA